MAGFFAQWGSTILRNLPYIISGGLGLYSVYSSISNSNSEKKAVTEAMELIKQNEDDINKLLEDRRQMMTMLEGLSIMMERLTQHYGSPGDHHLSHSDCCQHAAAAPCCHHDHEPREMSGCHHHGPRERCASHRRDPSGPCDLHHRGQGGPPYPGSHKREPQGHSTCPCSSHPELPQCQESSADEDYGAASSGSPSNTGSWKVCDVCYNNYNMTNRRPTILSCGHTFCRECIAQVALRGLLRCPTCKSYESRPAAALPPNVVLMVALEEESSSRRSGAENNRSDREEDDWKKSSTLLQEQDELQMQAALQLSMRSGTDNNRNDREEGDWKKTCTLLQEQEELQMQTALHLSMRQSGAETNTENDSGKENSELLQEEMLVQLAIHLSLESG